MGSMAGGLAGGALGGGLSLIGGLLAGNAADDARDEMKALMNRPGLSISDITRESLSNNDTYRLKAQEQAQKNNTFNQAEMNRQMELAHPGWTALQNKLMANTASMAGGYIPQDVQDRLYQSSAGRALEGGYAGTGMGRNLTARDFGLTSLGLQNQAIGNAGSLFNMAPRAGLTSAENFQINPQQLAQIRAAERGQQLQIGQAAAGMPSSGAVWGSTLGQMGQTMMGAGMGAAMGGMGGARPAFAGAGAGYNNGNTFSGMPNDWSGGASQVMGGYN